MAGKAGRSGRRSWKEELNHKEIFELSHQVLRYALKSNEIPLIEKARIATQLYNKFIPQQLEHSGSLTTDTKLIILRADEQSENKAETVSG